MFYLGHASTIYRGAVFSAFVPFFSGILVYMGFLGIFLRYITIYIPATYKENAHSPKKVCRCRKMCRIFANSAVVGTPLIAVNGTLLSMDNLASKNNIDNDMSLETHMRSI